MSLTTLSTGSFRTSFSTSLLDGYDEPEILRYPDASIAVLANVKLANGNTFGFLDIDHPGFVEFASRVAGPTPSKFGAKGITLFVQFEPGVRSKKIRPKDAKAPTIELMATSGMTVLPPSLHPSGVRYQWRDQPLHEHQPSDLPVMSTDKVRFVEMVGKHAAALAITEGGPDVKAHDLMLSLTASGIAQLNLDLEWMAHCLNGLFPRGYRGDTPTETLGMLQSARDKELGTLDLSGEAYQPGAAGPLVMGYLADSRFVFFDQGRRLLIVESSSRIISPGALLNLAPFDFWRQRFPHKNGFNAFVAGTTLMEAARAKGGFDERLIRGRGVYIDQGRVVRNFGEAPPANSRFVYVCPLPISLEQNGNTIDPAAVLAFFALFNFRSPSAPYILFGWLVSATVTGALDWRPHVFLTGAKNSGKTTLISAIEKLLDKVAVALDGQSTEAGIRQQLGADSLAVILDEFEADQDVPRLRKIIKLIRSASSGLLVITRGTPEGKALRFTIRASFLLAAINAMAVTAADRSRIVNLSLDAHDNDKRRAREIATAVQRFEGTSSNWCLQVMALTAEILASIKTLHRLFPPCDSRHATNMSTLLAAAWVMLHKREIDEERAEALIAEHVDIIDELAEAHAHDDATECLAALLQYSIGWGDGVRLLGEVLGHMRAMMQSGQRQTAPDNNFRMLEKQIARFGMKLDGDQLIIANSHRGLQEVFKGTLWEAGNWGDSLKRLPGAMATKQRRFEGNQRSLGTAVPIDLIPDHDDLGDLEF